MLGNMGYSDDPERKSRLSKEGFCSRYVMRKCCACSILCMLFVDLFMGFVYPSLVGHNGHLFIFGMQYHGGIIATVILHRWQTLRSGQTLKNEFRNCEVNIPDFVTIDLKSDWKNYLSDEIELSVVKSPKEVGNEASCKASLKCIGMTSDYRSVEALGLHAQDILYEKHESSTYCRSIYKISWDARHYPLEQVTGVSLHEVAEKCDAIDYCTSFSSTGWLYSWKEDAGVEKMTASLRLFIKPAYIMGRIWSMETVYPGLYGTSNAMVAEHTKDFKEWLGDIEEEPGNSVAAMTSDAILGKCSRKIVARAKGENNLLIVAWTDVYPEQGNAVQFIRKMMPYESVYIDEQTGNPMKIACAQYYTSKESDSLWSISEIFQIPLGALQDSNRDADFMAPGSSLQVGQRVCIPPKTSFSKDQQPQWLMITFGPAAQQAYITVNRYCLAIADGVLFDAPHIYQSPPPFLYKTARQIWVLLSYEGPRYTTDRVLEDPVAVQQFHLTATRSQHSHCPTTESLSFNPSWPMPFYSERQPAILYLYSNCKTASKRDTFARELTTPKQIYFKAYSDFKPVVPLKALGGCMRNSDWPSEISQTARSSTGWEDSKLKLSQQFVFELVAMNSLCESYIDEKLQLALKAGVIPIVIGPLDLLDFDVYHRKDPQTAFILVNFLPSIRSLQQHLYAVTHNEGLWMTYHAWRHSSNKVSIAKNPSPLHKEGDTSSAHMTSAFQCILDNVKTRSKSNEAHSSRAMPQQCVGSFLDLWWKTWRSRLFKIEHRIRWLNGPSNGNQYHFNGKRGVPGLAGPGSTGDLFRLSVMAKEPGRLRSKERATYFVVDPETNEVVRSKLSPMHSVKKTFGRERIDMLSWEEKMELATIVADIDFNWKYYESVKKLYYDNN